MTIKPENFVTGAGRRVLTDAAEPGMDARAGFGSTTEQHQARIAAAIFANAESLDERQLDEIVTWLNLYK